MDFSVVRLERFWNFCFDLWPFNCDFKPTEYTTISCTIGPLIQPTFLAIGIDFKTLCELREIFTAASCRFGIFV